MKATILPLGVRSANDHLYDLNSFAGRFPERMMGTVGYVDHPGPGDYAFEATNIRAEGDRVVADIRVLDNEQGREVAKLLESGQAVIRTRSVGEIDHGRIFSAEIESMAVIPADDDAFRGARTAERGGL